MSIFLILAFLFFIGAIAGWVLELFFRRWFSASNPERKWINPGFLIGPYLPIYGFGLCVLYLIASLENLQLFSSPFWNKALLFLTMAFCMTVIEYAAGVLMLKYANLRLWDYSRLWGNINGLICPLFSLIWAVLGAVYYFLIHGHILNALNWLSENLVFSFVIGMFYGVLIIDFAYSTQLAAKMRAFAKENDFVVKYEQFKADIRKLHDKNAEKPHFLLPFRSTRSLTDNLKHYYNHLKEWQELERVFRKKK